MYEFYRVIIIWHHNYSPRVQSLWLLLQNTSASTPNE